MRDAAAISKCNDDGKDSLSDIHAHFWPSHPQKGKAFGDSSRETHTLHASEMMPDQLTYVILFRNANPRWDDEQIIFTKSNLELLPVHLEGKDITEGEGPGSSIKKDASHVSNQQSGHIQEIRGTETIPDWYKISHFKLLEPYSSELCLVMEQKWKRADKSGMEYHGKRRPVSWDASLKHRWAVVEFARTTRLEVAEAFLESLRSRSWERNLARMST
ncbi:hypothetical protein K431DRAFT_224781 [Polychaeton citri CBS 116435]|uniref:Uncharacterized protein n=1 Tax=Polychaeton citri CBS 116435 TaxID=1314669 RepID=A0A9P4Q7Z3_9PEZI|nr:hypothetical protein K431DRAFT_224781 [Polychaeton citri CBS 116435]